MKLTKEDKSLIDACEKYGMKNRSKRHSVSATLVSKSGKIYNGMSMEFDCILGACAERTAFFKMMPEEDEIKTIVAMHKSDILPPCGSCREIMVQMNRKNLNNTWVIVSRREKIKLKDLLPKVWQKVFD
ncbi:cytidine deaminase [Candidatus Pacearchaeota archaeon]|nr:cytidine deaminase [Candidatus Pacearchaeota archaeon]